MNCNCSVNGSYGNENGSNSNGSKGNDNKVIRLTNVITISNGMRTT